MPRNQSLRRRAYCKIEYDGRDVTSALDPYLISVIVIDTFAGVDGGGSDRATVELDDRDARLDIPEPQMPLNVYLGWAGSGPDLDVPRRPTPPNPKELGWEFDSNLVFNGTITSVESGFSRGGGGRRLWVEAAGFDLALNGKTGELLTWGQGQNPDRSGAYDVPGGVQLPFGQVFTEFAKRAGYPGVFISPNLANIARSFWTSDGRSFHDWADNITKVLGARLKISGNSVYVLGSDGQAATAPLTQMGPFGNENYIWPTGDVDAYWGVNLLAWRIRPWATRPSYSAAKNVWFDTVNGTMKEVLFSAAQRAPPFMTNLATAALPAMAPNRQVGSQQNTGMKQDWDNMRGTGWVRINGEPHCRAGGQITIHGARPGVDGTYHIHEAEHRFLRAGGYTTRCEVRYPGWVAPSESGSGT